MRTVTITMEGGVIQHCDIPRGVRVVVIDYDCDGCDEVVKDHSGNDCLIHTWNHEPGLDAD